jgi:hypothetical protein
VDLDETLYGGDDAEDDIESVLLNLVASTIPKLRTFKRLSWYGGDAIQDYLYSILLNPVATLQNVGCG